jgi:hypothetical protein
VSSPVARRARDATKIREMEELFSDLLPTNMGDPPCGPCPPSSFILGCFHFIHYLSPSTQNRGLEHGRNSVSTAQQAKDKVFAALVLCLISDSVFLLAPVLNAHVPTPTSQGSTKGLPPP